MALSNTADHHGHLARKQHVLEAVVPLTASLKVRSLTLTLAEVQGDLQALEPPTAVRNSHYKRPADMMSVVTHHFKGSTL